MKITKHKKFGTPYVRIKDSKGGHYFFKAEIFDDGGGFYEMKTRKNQLHCREDGNIDDWIEDVGEALDYLNLLKDFLEDAKYEAMMAKIGDSPCKLKGRA